METLCALIRGDLAPAGNNISRVADLKSFSFQLSGYQASWLDSGTSALALALADAKAKAPHIKNPQVIIPGYCCPDLVAAAVFAGVRPVAVDIAGNDASYDLVQLKSALNENTLAVIAVNFLGVKERLEDIRALLQNTSIKLIEDNAQWFPTRSSEHHFLSDYVLFTFGRGKPLSLLGGGVLFSKENIIVGDLVKSLEKDSSFDRKLSIKLIAYNLLLNPHFYCYLNRAPFLHLGETCYHQMTEIVAMDSYRKALFSSNLKLHETRNAFAEQSYDSLFASSNIQTLESMSTSRRAKLLRYPLLCADSSTRDQLLKKLHSQGLGASPMYQHAIDEVEGVNGLIDVAGDLKNARYFASRFLTLPTHEFVSQKHIERLQRVVMVL